MRHALLLLYLLCFTVASASAQSLWGGASVGMSIDEVRRTQPDAIDNVEKPGHLKNGAVEKLRLPAVEIEGLRFAASFFFLNDKLHQVTLAASEIPSDIGLVKYQSLVTALKSKYGEEISRKFDRGSLGTMASSTWSSGRTTIQIQLFAFGSSPASIYVFYNSTLASAADRL